MSVNKSFPPSARRTRIARSLRYELGMSYKSIGDYLGLDKTSCRHLVHHGSTSSLPRTLSNSVRRFRINLSQ